ncbi:MAG: iron-containing alcohol dehydrogenase [Dehalococcoidia bacterium]|nr:iron-containing alcohol dehydrogenase [Dehalococcoidia bacterium]
MFASFPFRTAKKILFGTGTIDQVGTELKGVGATKTVIITDRTIREAGWADKIQAVLKESGISSTIWDEAQAEPSVEIGEQAIAFAREGGFDSVVGLGGGSAIDIAKAAAVSLKNQGTIMGWIKDGFTNPLAPLALCPTTAGTGSEVSDTAVFATPELKVGLVSSMLYPDVAIVDPTLTSSMPATVTANTGIDALCHAIEGYQSKQANPLTDALALESMRLVDKYLRAAYCNGGDMEAREGMALASLLAGIVMGNADTTIGHACGYAFVYPATKLHYPHGYAIAITLPYVMEYNAIAQLEKHANIAEVLGENIDGLSLRDAAFLAPVAFKKLLLDLDLPMSLRSVDVEKDMIQMLARNVLKSPNHCRRNPREVTEDGMITLFEHAYEGKLASEM